jgi:hypothetical protein
MPNTIQRFLSEATPCFNIVRAAQKPLLLEAALSALQRFLDGEFGIQHGIGTCKRDASPRFGCIEKDDPFPATWVCHLEDFKLESFVFHGRSSKRRHRKFLGLPRNETRLHVPPFSIDIRNHPRRYSDDGKGHDWKGKSDEFQAVSVRHLVTSRLLSKHISKRRGNENRNRRQGPIRSSTLIN